MDTWQKGKSVDTGHILKEIRKYDVDAIYLFGSHATGRVKPTSDLDICVIAGKGIPKEARDAILGNSSKNVDIVMFHDLPCAIQFRVFKEGKPLYVKDQKALQRVKADTIRSYLDFKPVIERHISRIFGG